jgi:hypothetical protein
MPGSDEAFPAADSIGAAIHADRIGKVTRRSAGPRS